MSRPVPFRTIQSPIVTVFGGSGFIGRHLITRLAAKGYRVRAVVRDVQAAQFLRPIGRIAQVTPWPGNITNPTSVAAAVKGASMVVNLVGILSTWGKQTFDRVHVEGAANVAKACTEHGVKKLIHLSAIGADKTSKSDYGRTKAEGEDAVLAAYPGATIMRPGVVFGPEDSFFNKFAALSRITMFMPVIGAPFIPEFSLTEKSDNGFNIHGLDINIYGQGGPKMQPVYVGDVASAMVNALAAKDAAGKIYELGGPATYTFKETMELMLSITGKKRWLVPWAYGVAETIGYGLGLLPKPILTADQVRFLHNDNVVSGDLPGLSDLGVQPQACEAILPTYLHRFRASTYSKV